MFEETACAVPDVLPVLGLLLMTLVGLTLIAAYVMVTHEDR